MARREKATSYADCACSRVCRAIGDMLMDETAPDGRRLGRAFLTFTYRPDVEWRPRHLTECLKRMRQWVMRRGVKPRYVWVAEQHKSGRVHYHAIVWLPTRPDDAEARQARLVAARLHECAVGTKGNRLPREVRDQNRNVSYRDFPRGCRLHGHGGLSVERRIHRAWWMLPKYQRDVANHPIEFVVLEGGGWRSATYWRMVACRNLWS